MVIDNHTFPWYLVSKEGVYPPPISLVTSFITEFCFQLVYCGHEYSIQNLSFGLSVEPENEAIKTKLDWSKAMRAKDPPEPTVPSTIGNFYQTLNNTVHL